MSFPLCYTVLNFQKNAHENIIPNPDMVEIFSILVPYTQNFSFVVILLQRKSSFETHAALI